MKLYDYAKVIRSKNAGPFTLTIDLMFSDKEKFIKAFNILSKKKNKIASLYGVRRNSVEVHAFPKAYSIKISFPRPISSGGVNDIDVYGSQQHFPLAEFEM